MRILHYLFGVPPVRLGGVPYYALDLARAQVERGNDVLILVPGPILSVKSSKTFIRRWKKEDNIVYYRIWNPQLIPNGFGIAEPQMFMRVGQEKEYIKWLDKVKVDIVHVHSFMGMHIEFLSALKQLKISTIFTTHDFFGLCPKIDLLKNDKECTEENWNNCSKCCGRAYGIRRLILEQSDLYRVYCGTQKIKKIFSGSYETRRENSKKSSTENVDSKPIYHFDYEPLRRYYMAMFGMIDLYHYNSIQTKKIFDNYIGNKRGQVIPVTNKYISDNRKVRNYPSTLRLGYLGSGMRLKGYHYLLSELDTVFMSGRHEFCLATYVVGKNLSREYIENKKPYDRSELENIFSNIDVLIVPSICRETFGMVVLEALSYGVPVLVSSMVGAKMFIEKYEGIGKIFVPQQGELNKLICHIYDNRVVLKEMNMAIMKAPFRFDYDYHVDYINQLYRDCMREKKGQNDQVSN